MNFHNHLSTNTAGPTEALSLKSTFVHVEQNDTRVQPGSNELTFYVINP
jgi:hypothetical protein